MSDIINFRSLPGLAGKLYRSSSLDFLSISDIRYLKETYHINTYVDFRSKSEQILNRTSEFLHGHQIQLLHLPIEVIKNDSLTGHFQSSEEYVDYCMRILDQGKTAFKSFFTCLADKNVFPLVFGCYAGKDRTGLCSYLVLSLLHYPREAIFADFIATNEALKANIERFEEKCIKHKLSQQAYLRQIQLSPKAFDLLVKKFSDVYQSPLYYLSRILEIQHDIITQVQTNLNVIL